MSQEMFTCRRSYLRTPVSKFIYLACQWNVPTKYGDRRTDKNIFKFELTVGVCSRGIFALEGLEQRR